MSGSEFKQFYRVIYPPIGTGRVVASPLLGSIKVVVCCHIRLQATIDDVLPMQLRSMK